MVYQNRYTFLQYFWIVKIQQYLIVFYNINSDCQISYLKSCKVSKKVLTCEIWSSLINYIDIINKLKCGIELVQWADIISK